MKSGHEHSLTVEQQSKVLELSQSMPEIQCFVYEGYLFEGERIEVAKRYIAENPSDSFWVWLHKNQRILFAPGVNDKPLVEKRGTKKNQEVF